MTNDIFSPYEFHFDSAGNGWLKVDHETIASAGFSLHDFSTSSYVTVEHIYLEEVYDARKFVARVEEITGDEPPIISIDDGIYSSIHTLDPNFGFGG